MALLWTSWTYRRRICLLPDVARATPMQPSLCTLTMVGLLGPEKSVLCLYLKISVWYNGSPPPPSPIYSRRKYFILFLVHFTQAEVLLRPVFPSVHTQKVSTRAKWGRTLEMHLSFYQLQGEHKALSQGSVYWIFLLDTVLWPFPQLVGTVTTGHQQHTWVYSGLFSWISILTSLFFFWVSLSLSCFFSSVFFSFFLNTSSSSKHQSTPTPATNSAPFSPSLPKYFPNF